MHKVHPANTNDNTKKMDCIFSSITTHPFITLRGKLQQSICVTNLAHPNTRICYSKQPKNRRYPRRTKLPPDFGVYLFLEKPRTETDMSTDTEQIKSIYGHNSDSPEEDDKEDHVNLDLAWESDEVEAISSLFQGRIPQKPGKVGRERPLPLPLPHKLRPLGFPMPKKHVKKSSARALLDYERHKTRGAELNIPISSQSEAMNVDNQASGSGRARRDAAARAMRGWHSRHFRNCEVSEPILKDKNSISQQKREKQLKSLGLLKRKKPSYLDCAVKASCTKVLKAHVETAVVDIGSPADWVKINVQKTKDCFEVYALVPGLLREEVRVQSDPAGRLVISGEPEHPDNPWGVTPFKKVVNLPSRIDPHQTSAVVTLHGQLFVRVPFEQS